MMTKMRKATSAESMPTTMYEMSSSCLASFRSARASVNLPTLGEPEGKRRTGNSSECSKDVHPVDSAIRWAKGHFH